MSTMILARLRGLPPVARVLAACTLALTTFTTLAHEAAAFHDYLRCTSPRNNLVLRRDTTFCRGTYRVRDYEGNGALIVGADNITIDANGTTLDGRTRNGFGIVLNGHSGVTIRNLRIRGYYYAIRAENASGLTIEGNDVSGNRITDDTFLDLNQPVEAASGGGILFVNVSGSSVLNNRGTQQDVGVNLYGSQGNLIQGNDLSDNNAWGIRLYASSENTVDNNLAHHVNRCDDRGCDSAGILVTNGSHFNTITNNDLTYSGDGFFIGNQFSAPSNDNLIEGNDGSFSPNNAFEATFSERNIFHNNVASSSNYGFWLGFSHHTTVENNQIAGNRSDGIAWEHGHEGVIAANTIDGNGRHGIWFDVNPNNHDFPHQVTSELHAITTNAITANGQYGISFSNTTSSRVEGNTIDGNAENLHFGGASAGNVVTGNDILNGMVVTETSPGFDQLAENNWWGTTDPSAIDALVLDGQDDPARGLIDYTPWLEQPAH